MRLRDFPSERCSWRDLYVIVKHSRADSHLFGVMFPERAGWTLNNVLVGHAVDALRLLLWSKTKAARHNSGRPKSILPFAKNGRQPRPKVKAAPLSEVKARLAKLYRRPGPQHRESEAEHAQRIRDIFKD